MSTKLGLIWTLWRKFASRIITPTDKIHFLKLDTEVPLFLLLPKRQPLLAAGNLWHPWHVNPATFQASSHVFHFSLASNLKLTASPSIGETFFFSFRAPLRWNFGLSSHWTNALPLTHGPSHFFGDGAYQLLSSFCWPSICSRNNLRKEEFILAHSWGYRPSWMGRCASESNYSHGSKDLKPLVTVHLPTGTRERGSLVLHSLFLFQSVWDLRPRNVSSYLSYMSPETPS